VDQSNHLLAVGITCYSCLLLWEGFSQEIDVAQGILDSTFINILLVVNKILYIRMCCYIVLIV
jgi:hypothetical protein